MARSSFLKSGAVTALAAALSLTALPSAASAQDQQVHGHGRWSPGPDTQGSGDSVQARDARIEAYLARRAAREQQQDSPAQTERAGHSDAEQGDHAARGWGSQRPDPGQRYGRYWQRGGEVARPDPAVNGAVAAVPDRPRRDDGWAAREGSREWAGRNRSYTDPERNRSYREDWRADRRHDEWGERHAYDYRWRGERRWDHDWRDDDRYDWQGYRSTHRHVYRPGRYYPPYRSYYYRQLGPGFYLDSLFFSSRYWIADPWSYRLPPAYGPYRWVRYYDDVLLVDIYSGEVVDVIHDFFW